MGFSPIAGSRHSRLRPYLVATAAVALAAGAAASATAANASTSANGAFAGYKAPATVSTALHGGNSSTPIKHLVVIFQENVSFDHYFGTYPTATNTSGVPFTAKHGTPSVNGLTGTLLTANPNGTNPQRLDPANVNDVLTCDQDHDYGPEQVAFDGGKMDKFVSAVGTGSGSKSPEGKPCTASTVMNYYDGNTVTALWNYAQHYAMSDNSYGTTFGPSSPGAINLASGNTGTVDTTHEANSPTIATKASPDADLTPNGLGGYSLTSDAQPYYDDCSTRDAVALSGPNIGDLLNQSGVSWGWFQGGFRPTTSYADALTAVGKSGQPTSTFVPNEFTKANLYTKVPHATNEGICNSVTPVGAGLPASLGTGTGQYGYKDNYIPHHEPFEYYASTANPHHLTIPTNAAGQDTVAGLSQIGWDTQSYAKGVPQFNTPNHQYDSSDFDQLVAAIGQHKLPSSALPAVSFLKAPGWQDGHAGYSDPLDEQQWIVNEINALQKSPDWSSTAVIVSYDDSDGWYDHAYSGVTNPSASVADALTGAGVCGSGTPLAGENGRCGYGPRLPLLVVSPWAKRNYVSSTLTSQTSITKFIEDNWLYGKRIPGSFDSVTGSLSDLFAFHGGHQEPKNGAPFLLSPVTGKPVTG
jgi:phospholipase C